MPLLLKEDMKAPKDTISYKQTKKNFFFGKNSRFLAFKTFPPLLGKRVSSKKSNAMQLFPNGSLILWMIQGSVI